MKQLRILTGAHAGAQIRLTPGDYRTGPDDAADICITDWNEPSIWISVDEAGAARWCRAVPISGQDADPSSEDSHDGEPVITWIQDLVPVPFNEIVICIGPENQPWPSDIEILRTLWVRDDAPGDNALPARRPSSRMLGLALGVGMLGALLVVGMTLFGAQTSSANPTPQQLAWHIKTALHSAGLNELQAVPRGSTVAVTGMVATAAGDVTARSVFERIAKDPDQILRQYDVVENDQRNFEEALGIANLHIEYAGAGIFKVSGIVPSMTQFNAALTRVRDDLNSNIKRIDVAVTEATPTDIPYSQAIGLSDMRYIETPDGVKHLYADEAANDAPNETPSEPASSVEASKQSESQPPSTAEASKQNAPEPQSVAEASEQAAPLPTMWMQTTSTQTSVKQAAPGKASPSSPH